MAARGANAAYDLSEISEQPADMPSLDEIAAYHLVDEARLAGGLIERAVFTHDERQHTRVLASQLVRQARADRNKYAGIDAFMEEYGLSTDEGAILMCIAESLLRIPDSDTADLLVAEKISEGAWEKHIGHSDSLFVNASTWGLMLSGRIVKLKDTTGYDAVSVVKRVIARSGEPVIRQAVRQAVHILGDQFVLGPEISKAIDRGRKFEADGYTLSYDMLGEPAHTEADALAYFDRYEEAIEAVGRACGPLASEHPDALMRRAGISIKLSCLHPRFEAGKTERLSDELGPRLMALLRLARQQGVSVCLDAEEQDRLEPMLRVFADAYLHPELDGWHGLGIAVQAYSKRAIPELRWLRRLSQIRGRRIPVRLVKGAYWDSEVKWAQERALSDYPVFTRKLNTDLSYLACMRLLLSDAKAFYPQFATHNAYSLAAGLVAGGNKVFEFQRLHGMGESLYGQIVSGDAFEDIPCRIYAPVGGHDHLLSFLVRRILENGANTSFINRLADNDAPVADIVADPVAWAERELHSGTAVVAPPLKEAARADASDGAPMSDDGAAMPGSSMSQYALAGTRNPLAKPDATFLPERRRAAGTPLSNSSVTQKLLADVGAVLEAPFDTGPIVSGEETVGEAAGARRVVCPHDIRQHFGTVCDAGGQHIDRALSSADAMAASWERVPAQKRADILEKASQLFERDRARLVAVMVRESGRTLPGALEEVRQTVDLLRYYAGETRVLFGEPLFFKGTTGETNRHGLRGRGPFVCISPWNAPLSVFTGQVVAALGAGNTVLAKPSEYAPAVASIAVKLLHEAGIPADALHFLPGDVAVGARLVSDTRIAGVAFTGQIQTAWAVQKQISDRRDTFIPFICATGGLNTMIADSSALCEEVVRDCVRSGFGDSGMRCSSARVLFVQDEIAHQTIDMLAGAVSALDMGDPLALSTDIGPTITESAQDGLDSHKHRMARDGREVVDCALPDALRVGHYVTPAVYEIDNIDVVGGDYLGPIVHVVRFERGYLSRVIDQINKSGYGLTMGLHSRIGSVAEFVGERARVGNLYINRDQVGVQVGAQPLGGERLSGGGCHAGGPHYLARFASERVRTCNVTSTGGNLDLLRRASVKPGLD